MKEDFFSYLTFVTIFSGSCWLKTWKKLEPMLFFSLSLNREKKNGKENFVGEEPLELDEKIGREGT